MGFSIEKFEERYLGRRYGRLTVIGISGIGKYSRCVDLICKCDCGTEKIINAAGLNNGTTTSCGCYHLERISEASRERSITHGGTAGGRERLYRIWCCMKQRCYYQNQKPYKNYGGRGIVVCGEWEHDYAAFKQWALCNGYSDDLTLDRINNDGNYEPSNCRWATYSQQARNKRHPHREDMHEKG